MNDSSQNQPAESSPAESSPAAFSREIPSAQPWLAHYSAGMPPSVDVPEQPLTWLLDEASGRHGANVALSYYGTEITYAQLAALANRFARALAQMGVRRGDRVSICLPNVPQFPIAFYGVLKAGAIAVPTNPLYTERELEHQLRDAGAKVAITLEQLYPTLAAVRDRTPVERVILTSPADYLPPALGMLYRLREAVQSRGKPRVDSRVRKADPTLYSFKALLGRASGRQGYEVFELPAPSEPDDLAVLQYTGGTTGLSKGTMLTHRNLLANAMQTWAWSEQSEAEPHTSLCVAPFFHVYGLTVAMNLSIHAGARMVLLPRFTVKDVLKAIARQRPDMFPGVPTMYLA
ncbi:MAG: AMP-binding protein, partial [Ktedonobacterales bacterium]